MSSSPKSCAVELEAARRQAAEQDRQRRVEARERERREREAAKIAEACSEVRKRAGLLRSQVVDADRDRRTLGQTGSALVEAAEEAAAATPRSLHEATELRRRLDRLQADLDSERTRLAETGPALALARLRELNDAIKGLPSSSRLAHDRETAKEIEPDLRQLHLIARGSDVTAAARLLRELAPKIERHVQRVRAGMSADESAREQVGARSAALRTWLERLVEDAAAAGVSYDDATALAADLDKLDRLTSRGPLAEAESLADALDLRLKASESTLDDRTDRIIVARSLMAGIVENLPELGLQMSPGTLKERPDGSLTMRALTSTHDGLDVEVAPSDSGLTVRYRSHRIEDHGPEAGACDDVVAVGTAIGSVLRHDGFLVGELHWDDGPHGEYGSRLISTTGPGANSSATTDQEWALDA